MELNEAKEHIKYLEERHQQNRDEINKLEREVREVKTINSHYHGVVWLLMRKFGINALELSNEELKQAEGLLINLVREEILDNGNTTIKVRVTKND